MSLSLALGALSFLLALVLGHPFVEFLRSRGVGKQVRDVVPTSHEVKAGTPTMGGLLIVATTLVVTGLASLVFYREVGRSILLPLSVLVATATLGVIDDRLSLIGALGGGLSIRVKLAWLLLIGAVAAFGLWHPSLLGIDYVFVPTVREALHLAGWFFIPFATLVIVATANAVNFSDGLDSLAGITAFFAFIAYGVIAFLQEQYFLVTFCFTVVGAIAAFLWFNAHPAEVFMGDTGSLALGASLAVVALMTGHALLLPVIGLLFVAEAGSVVLQIAYFRLTNGKRLFRRAPLHHHFEEMGWPETHIVQRFWLVSLLSGMVGIALALL